MRWPKDTKLRERWGRLLRASLVFVTGYRRIDGRSSPLGNAKGPPTPGLCVRVSAGRPAEEKVWAGRLAEEEASLLSLVRGIETEFLATGEALTPLGLKFG